MNLYKYNQVRLICLNGAITQPFGMEYHQTKINAVESGGKISEELEPSTLKVKSLDTAINDRYIAFCDSAAFLAGEVL